MNEKDLGSRVEPSVVAPERLDLPRSSQRDGSQHTPGPWSFPLGDGIHRFDILGPKAEDIAYVNESDGADDPETYPAVANGRLMAAAPDLLAACKHMVESWSAMDADEHASLTMARTAIAKAEGR